MAYMAVAKMAQLPSQTKRIPESEEILQEVELAAHDITSGSSCFH